MFFFCIQVEVEEGSLVCPESGKKFPIKNGIPNMLLNEDEVWIYPKLELFCRFNECMYSELTIISCAIRSLRLYLYQHQYNGNWYDGWVGLWAAGCGWGYNGSLFSAGQQFDSRSCLYSCEAVQLLNNSCTESVIFNDSWIS